MSHFFYSGSHTIVAYSGMECTRVKYASSLILVVPHASLGVYSQRSVGFTACDSDLFVPSCIFQNCHSHSHTCTWSCQLSPAGVPRGSVFQRPILGHFLETIIVYHTTCIHATGADCHFFKVSANATCTRRHLQLTLY